MKHDGSSKLARHRAEVYHSAFDIVLNDLKLPARHGTVLKLLHGLKSGTPILATVSADYEEMCVNYTDPSRLLLTLQTKGTTVWYPRAK